MLSLIEAGVSVFRLNFSHGSHEEKGETIKSIRQVSAEAGRTTAILLDLQGPKIRVGPLTTPEVTLIKGEQLQLFGDNRLGDEKAISVSYPHLASEVGPGELVFIDDGLIELRVSRVSGDTVEAEVVIGGALRSGEGVNLPGIELSTPSLTDKDRDDLRFGLEAGVDMVALSFVRRPSDAEPVREIFRELGVDLPICAKVERREAVEDIVGIVKEFEMVMVARGDLGVNLRPEKVPTAQKLIIKTAAEYGKPVITATQMLETMTHNSIPTRAEASDVANAVFDGTDAVMLSGETAIGLYPVESVQTMDRIVREAESQLTPRAEAVAPVSTMVGFCTAAVRLAEQVEASAIAALTRNGENARILSALRPQLPIIALCEDESLVYRLSMYHGIMPMYIGHMPAIEEASERICREIASRGLLPNGAPVVVVGITPESLTGKTDFIRLVTV